MLRKLKARRARLRARAKRILGALKAMKGVRVPKGARPARKRLGERLRTLRKNVRRGVAKVKRRLAEERERRKAFAPSPGDPHWGGSDDVLRLVVDPLVLKHRGVRPNSAKRTETYGNPGSDHHTSQTLASARDYPLVNDFAMRDIIARELVGRALGDYEHGEFTYQGVRFRVQLIAQNHGTGPHLHVGVRRA